MLPSPAAMLLPAGVPPTLVPRGPAEPEGIRKESSALGPAAVLVLSAASPLLTAVAISTLHGKHRPRAPASPKRKMQISANSVQFCLPRCQRTQSSFERFKTESQQQIVLSESETLGLLLQPPLSVRAAFAVHR